MVVTSVPPARTSAAEDLAADHVEHHVNFANILQLVGFQVQEGMHSQSEGGFTVRCPSSANHDGSDFAGELHRDRTDTAGGAVDQDGLACREVGVVDERLPRRQPGDRQGSGHGVIDVSRKGSEVARLHCAVFGQGAVASPVAQAEYPLAHTEAGGSVPQLDDDSRQLVAGHARRPVAPGAVDPGPRPVQLAGGEPGGMHPFDDVVLGGVRVGHIGQGESTDAGIAVSNGDGLHGRSLLWRLVDVCSVDPRRN
jgi:hypothetical protein